MVPGLPQHEIQNAEDTNLLILLLVVLAICAMMYSQSQRLSARLQLPPKVYTLQYQEMDTLHEVESLRRSDRRAARDAHLLSI
jgi:hypothetical protein